jgi:hypothetical protein
MAEATRAIPQQLTAFNAAISHLDTLGRLALDLHNTDIQVLNRAKQAWQQATGKSAPVTFDNTKNALSGEYAQALKKSGATDEEIASVKESFSRAQSPAQLRDGIAVSREILTAKATALMRQYEAGLKGQPVSPGAGQAGVNVTNRQGVVHQFPNQEAADRYKKAAGIQ